VATGRWAAWLDLPEVFEETAELTLSFSSPDKVEDFTVILDGTEVELEGESAPWTMTVVASDLPTGDISIETTVSWLDGDQSQSTSSVSVLEGGIVTWAGDIEPLYVDHCQLCHAGDSNTVLNSQELWESRFDDIWEQVDAGAMPLGADPLSDIQLDRLLSWQEGGFQ
jgi:hypothetical protein